MANTITIQKGAQITASSTDKIELTFTDTDSGTGVLTMKYGDTTIQIDNVQRILSAQNLVLSSKQYGSTLPSSGVEGQLFFLKI